MKKKLLFKYWYGTKHRNLIVQFAHTLLRTVPYKVKYTIGKNMRKDKLPYSLINNGDSVIQIGAPRNIMSAGRSRAIYFSLFAGANGKVIIIEPEEDNVKYLRSFVDKHKLKNVLIEPVAASSEKKILKLVTYDDNPSHNFTIDDEITVEDNSQPDIGERLDWRARMANDGYQLHQVPADTIDNIIASHGISRVDLVSITTNGAEDEILGGMKNALETGIPYISVAGLKNRYEGLMQTLGYLNIGKDDRGFTFKTTDHI